MTSLDSLAALIDLSSEPPAEAASALQLLSRADTLGGCVGRAVVAVAESAAPLVADLELPDGWQVTSSVLPDQACQWAFDIAGDADTSLLVVGAGARPSGEAVAVLREAMLLDPMFGIAIPRFFDEASGRIALHEPFGWSGTTAPRRIMGLLRDYRIVSARIAPCMVIRRELAANLSFQAGQPLWNRLADFVLRARRAGFRPVLCNRAIVPVAAGAKQSAFACEPAAIEQLRKVYAERPPAGDQSESADNGEALLARAIDRPKSLVIDARNLGRIHNGTSLAILSMCDALYRSRPDDDMTIWAHADVVEWWELGSRFRAWNIATATPAERYAAGVRLSQPWHASELESLSDIAAVNVYWMLDTIAWDIAYTAPETLDGVWERLACDADGILFISEFSRRQFVNRFPVSPQVSLGSCPLSLDPADYALPAGDRPEPPYWLVVGNQYDHKHVAPTVDLLARSFPRQRLVVFGDRDRPRAARVTRFESGEVDEAVVRGCYAAADVVLFPSFYEGFGIPIVQGLSYGRTVVARDSDLVRELAALYRGPGRLCVYSTERELVDLLSRLQRGTPVPALPLGSAPGAGAWNWHAVAACLLQTTNRLVSEGPTPQMLRRNRLGRGLTSPQHAR